MNTKLLTQETACDKLARELCAQPELAAFFSDLDGLQPESALPVGSSKVYAYTGNKSQVSELTKLKLGAMRLLGASDREIERELRVDHRSIPIHLAELEQTGQLPALKERLTRLVGDNAERSSLLLRKLLNDALDGTCTLDLAAMLKAAGSVNCFQVEKYQLLTGGATEILEHRVAGAGREEIERWWKEQAVPVEATVQASGLLPSESSSIATPAKHEESSTSSGAGHGADTSAIATGTPDVRTAPGPSQAADGAGGVEDGQPPENSDSSTAV